VEGERPRKIVEALRWNGYKRRREITPPGKRIYSRKKGKKNPHSLGQQNKPPPMADQYRAGSRSEGLRERGGEGTKNAKKKRDLFLNGSSRVVKNKKTAMTETGKRPEKGERMNPPK